MRDGEQLAMLILVFTIVGLGMYYRRWRGSGSSHGTARWATDKDLKKAGML